MKRPALFRRRRRARKGFTLLEVIIAMSILVVALAALSGHQSLAIQMSDYSNKLSQGILLAEAKLLDVEDEMMRDSVDVFDGCREGDFNDYGFRRRYRWKACGYKLEVQDGAAEMLTEKVLGMLSGMGLGGGDIGGAGDPAGAAGGLQGLAGNDRLTGQIAMATGMIPTFIQQLEDKLRKVSVEVRWTDATGDRVVVMERFVTALGNLPGNQPPPEDGKAPVNPIPPVR